MPEPATIDGVLDAFLSKQRVRLWDRTYRNYEDVIGLLRHSLDNYGYVSLNDRDARRWQAAVEAGDEEAFCHMFGPAKIPGHLSEFLGYYMVRKVMAGQELLKAAGTVTGKLVRWLQTEGHIESDAAELAADRARRSARDLPAADRLGSLLHEVASSAPEIGDVDDDDWVEDQLTISEIEPGRIWFEGGVGPFDVPKQASELARPGWMVSVCAARVAGRWHLVDVGLVYP